jgi:Cd2+/Zn2+-exporting ATPase
MHTPFQSLWDWIMNYHLTLAPIFCAFFGLIGWGLHWGGFPSWRIPLLILAYLAGGTQSFSKGVKALWQRSIDVDLLMVVAALGAAVIGEWEEGAVLLFLFSLSNALQDYALDRTQAAIRALMKLRPTEARVLRHDGLSMLPLAEVAIGEKILVKPGERLPLDGIITSGSSHLDQSPITGESIPVYKERGERVFAGSINQEGSLEIEVTQRAEDTTLAKIIRMVEEARAQKARTERWIEHFEQYYAAVIILGTMAVIFALWWLLAWTPGQAFYFAMTLLVVASPCALVISAPAASFSAIAHLARRGILTKGGIHLEGMAQIKAIAFDKTGTLTEGSPRVEELIPTEGIAADELLRIVASVENLSEHPLAKAITAAAHEHGLTLVEVSDLQSVRQGIVASLGTQRIGVGNLRFFAYWEKPVPKEMQEQAMILAAEGKTVIGAHDGERFLGLITIRDLIRPAAREALSALRQAGIHTVMLTGDNEQVAATIAKEVGVDEYYSELLPEEKVLILEQLEKQWGTVAMVGDGVNDAPALATATVGIAMGAAGSDVALETADLVLMNDHLMAIPYAIRLSRKTQRIVWQNITFSLGVIVILLLLALGGKISLSLGVFGHEGSTIIVVSNALRLLSARATL